MNHQRRIPLFVALIGVAFAASVALRILVESSWDPTVFVAFGEEAEATTEYGRQRLGDIHLRPWEGHDGKFFFVQAHDPLLRDTSRHAAFLDRPLYRSHRMLYPLLAGGLGAFGSDTIVWALLAVNLIAMGVGTWATSLVAVQMGESPWWGLAFPLNLGLISELGIDGAGVMAAALAFLAVAVLQRRRVGWAVALVALSALSREVMLITAAGCAWWLWNRGDRRSGTIMASVPVVTVGIWAAYTRTRLGWGEGAAAGGNAFGLPFEGIWLSIQDWLAPPHNAPLDPVVGLATVLLFALYVRRTLRSNALVGWAFIGFIPISVFFSWHVWLKYFDITRAVAPVFTAFVLLVALSERSAGPRLEQGAESDWRVSTAERSS